MALALIRARIDTAQNGTADLDVLLLPGYGCALSDVDRTPQRIVVVDGCSEAGRRVRAVHIFMLDSVSVAD